MYAAHGLYSTLHQLVKNYFRVKRQDMKMLVLVHPIARNHFRFNSEIREASKKRRSHCRVKGAVRYRMADYNIHFINQGIIVRIS